jgi:hypothetical protein
MRAQLKVTGPGQFSHPGPLTLASAPAGEMPGAGGFAFERCCVLIRFSIDPISVRIASSCPASAGHKVPAVRQKLHLSSCADFRDRLCFMAEVLKTTADLTAQNEAIRKLSGEVGLTEGAVRAVLSSLGKDQAAIPHERLSR